MIFPMTRRLFCGTALLCATLVQPAFSAKYFVYSGAFTTGIYSSGKSKGISAFRFDSATGEMEPMGLVAEVSNPTFLVLHPKGRFLYAVNENGPETPGQVTAYSIDDKTGALTLLNTAPSGGLGPCYLEVDKTGKTLLISNFLGGSTATVPLEENGRLGQTPFVIEHKGPVSNLPRQDAHHPHMAVASADNKFVFAPDLGSDQVLSFLFDAAKRTLIANDPPFITAERGGGPRHFAFHPKGKFAYMNNELTATLAVYAYDSRHGVLKELQVISSLPADYKGSRNNAELEIDAKGRFLYVSNRGHDSIGVFAIGPDGKLTLVEHTPTQGKSPRNFKIDPTGTHLLVGNHRSGTVVPFRINVQSGRLTPTGKMIEIPDPVCLVFVAAR
jgi:6-phosphogluconolactonase